MKIVNSAALILAFLICAVLGQQIVSLSNQNQQRKNDYAEINNIKYGLFSIDQWKRQLSDIIKDEVTDFDPRSSEKELKPVIEAQLAKLIDSVEARVRSKNKDSFKGRLKQAFIDTFVDMKDIRAGIPQYADELFKLIQKKSTKITLKSLIADKVESYFEKTFEDQNISAVDKILAKLHVAEPQAAKDILDQEIAENQKHLFLLTWILIGFATLCFLIAGLAGKPLSKQQFVVFVLILLVLLICGVTTPMIDLEAKISEMSFVLMDHPVKFLNQILYFQTKSVADVFLLMITDSKLQVQIVGLLMVMFSIAFPVAKLIFSIIYYYSGIHSRQNMIVNFFVLKSGKWSMTDVMVVAIFMAYIGFNGIISNQFSKIPSGEENIVFLTTNGTSLQQGFYLFLAYAVLALFLSGFLTRKFD